MLSSMCFMCYIQHTCWHIWVGYTYVYIYAAHAGPVRLYAYRTCVDDGANFVHIAPQFLIINTDGYWSIGCDKAPAHTCKYISFLWRKTTLPSIYCHVFKGMFYSLIVHCLCHISLSTCIAYQLQQFIKCLGNKLFVNLWLKNTAFLSASVKNKLLF